MTSMHTFRTLIDDHANLDGVLSIDDNQNAYTLSYGGWNLELRPWVRKPSQSLGLIQLSIVQQSLQSIFSQMAR